MGTRTRPAPWLEGAEYQYRLGRHRLILALRGVPGHREAAVGRAEAEFALVVEGPLLVFGYRFGDATPWSWAAPYNWHFAPPAERVVPAAIDLTPESYARLWATLWITLVDIDDGRVRVCRAVALRPEFTHALHGVLREQALRPFRGAAADRALDGLRDSATPLALRARVRTRCAAVSDYGADGLATRAGRDDAAQCISMRNTDVSRPATSIIITDGSWMHIRHTRIYHRHYPEVRGEGRSLADAAGHLMNQLASPSISPTAASVRRSSGPSPTSGRPHHGHGIGRDARRGSMTRGSPPNRPLQSFVCVEISTCQRLLIRGVPRG